MRKIWIATALVITAGTAFSLFLHFMVMPSRVEAHILRSLKNAGFGEIKAARIETQPEKISIHKLSLDQNEFTRINALTVRYRTSAFLFDGTLDSLTILAPELSLDIRKNGELDITGLPGGLPLTPLKGLTKIRHIKIEDGTLDLFHEAMGSMRVRFDGESHITEAGRHEPQMHFETAQKRLSADISLQGQINPDGAWSFSFMINDAGLETDQISFNRVTASLTSAGTNTENYFNAGEFNAGSLRLYNTLWKNVNGTVEVQPGSTNALISSQNNNNENLELTLAYSNQTPGLVRCRLFGKSFDDLITFAGEQSFLTDTVWPDFVRGLPDLTLQFDWPVPQSKAPEHFPFRLSHSSYGLSMAGVINGLQDIRDLQINAFGGTLQADGLETKKLPYQTNLTIQNLNLAEINKALLYEGVELSGTLSGTLPLTISDTEITAKAGELKNTAPGQIKIPQRWTSLLFDDREEGTANTRQALTHYNFDQLSMEVDGNLLGKPELSLVLHGYNPEMFEGNNFTMTLDFQKELSPLFVKQNQRP